MVDGTNCTIGTTSTTLGYGLATYSNSAAGSANWAEFRILVPNDLDNTVDPRARIADLLAGADTGTRRYVVTLTDVASSASATPTPSATVTNVDIVMPRRERGRGHFFLHLLRGRDCRRLDPRPPPSHPGGPRRLERHRHFDRQLNPHLRRN